MKTLSISSSPKGTATAHSYTLTSGVQVNIEAGEAQNYADMRTAQLAALMNVIMLAENCDHSKMGDKIRSNIQWLAASLANEVHQLIEIVADDAEVQPSHH